MSIVEDQKNVLQDFTERLEKLGIDYMLTGSMALVNYAMMRMTNDIDIVVDLKSEETDKFIGEFKTDFYIPEKRVRDAVLRKSMFNLLHQEKIIKIDCIVCKDTEFQKQAFKNRAKIKFANDFDVWIIEREDLILSKLLWAKETRSEMQIRDVASILRNGFDEDYVNKWTRKLGVEDLLIQAQEKLKENAQ